MDKTILIVEPFYGGSHKQLIDTLIPVLNNNYDLITLSAKKWPWRARCGALKLSQIIEKNHKYKTLFCSSVLNLAELIGLRNDLQSLRKVVYFHENELLYPKQDIKDRDFQFGYNQITTCLVADTIVFNSHYNMNSFLNNINKFIKLMPDFRPKDLRENIEHKCTMLYFPINFTQIPQNSNKPNVLHIIWPHRWEFDKGPDIFFEIIFKLKEISPHFYISVVGETFSQVPDVFNKSKELLSENILHWGFVESRDKYYEVLNSGHVVISTAKHEFYGVAVLEAVYCGCYPLLPNRLVYPELYNKECLYNDSDEAVTKLTDMANNLHKYKLKFNFEHFSTETLIPKYKQLLFYSIVIISTSSSLFLSILGLSGL